MESVSANVTNATTPGYKAQRGFSTAVNAQSVQSVPPLFALMTNFAQGGLKPTGNMLDFAITGAGFFVVRHDDQEFLTRNGVFRVNEDGALVTPGGLFLQGDGGDIIVATQTPVLLSNGTLTEEGNAIARLRIVAVPDEALTRVSDGMFINTGSEMVEVAAPVLRQAMVETSNVSLASEMVQMMSSLRQAEVGQRFVQLYDDLSGRAISIFGQV